MKKKRIFIILPIIILMIFGFSSCGDNTAKHIPEDAFFVAVIDGKNLTDYGKKLYVADNEDIKALRDEFGADFKNTMKIFDDFMDNPNSSGILFKSKSYGFARMIDEKIVAGIIIPINKSVLEDNMEAIGKDFGFPLSMMFKTKNDLVYFQPDGSSIIAYSDDILIMLYNDSSEDVFELAEEMFMQEKGNSIMNNKDFSTFLKNCKDINFWISTDIVQLVDESIDEIQEFEDLTGVNIAGNYGHFHLSISSEEIVYTQKMRFNESIQNLDIEKLIENADKIIAIFDSPYTKGMDLFNLGGYDDDWDDWDESEWMNMSDEELEKELEALLQELGEL